MAASSESSAFLAPFGTDFMHRVPPQTLAPLPESEYFRELAELLQECLGSSLQSSDMSTLRDMVRQLKEKKSAVAVQEGDVSSSGSAVLASHVGPMVLEALDGFFFVLNPEGWIEFVSQNVVRYLNYAQGDVQNRSIFNFLAPGDHELFTRLLPADAIGFHLMQFAAPTERKSQSFMCRFQRRQDSPNEPVGLVTLHVSAISLPYPLDPHRAEDDFFNSFSMGSERSCLVCVARRISEKTSPVSNESGARQPHFALSCDPASGLVKSTEIRDLPKDTPLGSALANLRGCKLQELCSKADQPVAGTLLESAASQCSSQFGLRLPDGPLLSVQARSHKQNNTTFIDCTVLRFNNQPFEQPTTKDQPMLSPLNVQQSTVTSQISPAFDSISSSGSDCPSSTQPGDTLHQLCHSIFSDPADVPQESNSAMLKSLLDEEERTPVSSSCMAPQSVPVSASDQFYMQTQFAAQNPMPTQTGSNPTFYIPDSFPDGRGSNFMPPSMKTPAKVTKPRKPRKNAAAAGTGRPGRGRRKKAAAPAPNTTVTPIPLMNGPPRWPPPGPQQAMFGYDGNMMVQTSMQTQMGKDVILKQLLRSDEMGGMPQQMIADDMSGMAPGTPQWSAPSPRTPTAPQGPFPTGIRPANSSMLVKLLEHPPAHQPTLPTSIATSPLDKMALENKDSPNAPMLNTKLSESLLTKQKIRPPVNMSTASISVSSPLPQTNLVSSTTYPMQGYPQTSMNYSGYQHQYGYPTQMFEQSFAQQQQPPPYVSEASQLQRRTSTETAPFVSAHQKYPTPQQPMSAPVFAPRMYAPTAFPFEPNQQVWSQKVRNIDIRTPWSAPNERKIGMDSNGGRPPPAYPGTEAEHNGPFEQNPTANVEPSFFADIGLDTAFDMDDESTRNLVQRLLS